MSNANVRISSGELAAEVSPFGAEIQRLTNSAGRDLQWSGDAAVWSGRAPILFPVIGLLQGGQYRYDGQSFAMPKHGFARHSMFAVAARAPRSVTMRLQASAETREIYPFEFQLDVTFSVTAETLSIAAEIANLGGSIMPASFGFHPAFRWPLPYGEPRADHRLEFEQPEPAPVRRIDADGFLIAQPQPTPVSGEILELRDDLFAADALIFDRLTSRSVRYGAPAGPSLKVDFPDFPTLGVWTKTGAEFICIEPWHGFSDPEAFAGDIFDKPGIMAIAPGGTRSMAMHVTLQPAGAML